MKVSAPYVNEVVSAVCGILMLCGVITPDGEDEELKLPEDTSGVEDDPR